MFAGGKRLWRRLTGQERLSPPQTEPPAPEGGAAPVPVTAAPTPRRGRLSRAMSLFGQAFGTLFGGGDE